MSRERAGVTVHAVDPPERRVGEMAEDSIQRTGTDGELLLVHGLRRGLMHLIPGPVVMGKMALQRRFVRLTEDGRQCA